MPRGGKRNGRPGQSYQNRSDLAIPKVVPGQQYGQGVQQAAVAQAMPESSPAAPVPPGVLPGSLGPLTRPTERPDEPLSAGAPWGPGPNELSGLPNGQDTLAYNDSQDIKPYMNSLRMMEWLASQPNSSPSVRILYRQLLSNRPGGQNGTA